MKLKAKTTTVAFSGNRLSRKRELPELATVESVRNEISQPEKTPSTLRQLQRAALRETQLHPGKHSHPVAGNGRVLADPPQEIRRPSQEGTTKADIAYFAGAVAHELRQPLSTIQLIAAHLKTSLPPSTVNPETLTILEQQAQLAGQILANLVSFACSGKPQKADADLNQLLRIALKRISWRPEITLIQTLARRLPRASADPIHVDRIISNLVNNALESMEGPGTLSITTRSEGAEVVLQIADTGCGVGPEHRERIFLPFATTKSNGMGLGLALCCQFAESNGGSIGFDSHQGKGAVFELRLPRA